MNARNPAAAPAAGEFVLPASERFSWRRVGALALRHAFVFRRSWPRIIDLLYWPFMNLLVWGFITRFFVSHSSWIMQATGVFITGVLLWDVLFRTNLGVGLSFLEEMWARNLGQLFVSPLRPTEMMAGIVLIGSVRALLAVFPAMILALPIFGFWVFSIGLPLYAFFVNLLVMGWWVGLFVSAVVLRYGLGAENICWAVLFLIAPIACVYYPVATLPGWMQAVAWTLPTGYVFEGMRAVLLGEGFRVDLLLGAVALNAVYGALAALFFLKMFDVARVRGLLLRQGE
ncbi:MAG: ABC transporter permease [Rhodospirillales bacterium]|nr:ABC transporter permease [Rhodospirillales bacterium]